MKRHKGEEKMTIGNKYWKIKNSLLSTFIYESVFFDEKMSENIYNFAIDNISFLQKQFKTTTSCYRLPPKISPQLDKLPL